MSMIADPTPVLRFGALAAAGPGTVGAAFEIAALSSSEGTTFGNSDPIMTTIQSLLGDGELVTIDRQGNRQAQIAIMIYGSDAAALARAEAVLIAETKRRNILTWLGVDGFAPATVFDVITSYAEHVFNDEDELRSRRRYTLHLTLYPSSRSATITTVPASGSGVTPGAPPTTVLVTNADTTAGWVTEDPARTVVDNGDRVSVAESTNGNAILKYVAPTAVDYSLTPLLVVDYRTTQVSPGPLRGYVPATLNAGDREIPRISSSPSPIGPGLTRVVFDASVYAASLRYFRFVSQSPSGPHVYEDLHIANVEMSNGQVSYTGTTRQLFRGLQVGGSERAIASLQLSHTADGLGETLVWSGPARAVFPLRSYRTVGAGATADPTTVSGAHEPIDGVPFVADIPVSQLPEGTYALLARLKSSSSPGARTITASTQTISETGGTPIGDIPTTGATIVTTDTDWHVHACGWFDLPPTASRSADAVATVAIGATGGTLTVDEFWLMNLTDGSLTWISDVPEKNLWIDAPSIDSPRPRLWAGDTADKSDAYDITSKAKSWGLHQFNPGTWNAFTVTAGAENAAVTAEYSKRWHTHAAE